jgi:YggT family protein
MGKGEELMLIKIADLLIRTLFDLFVYVVLLRFWMQAVRAPFRNPLGGFTMALTDWAVLPLRRVIPALRGYDVASLVLGWLVVLLKGALLAALAGATLSLFALLIFAPIELVRLFLHLLIIVTLAQAILSMVAPHSPFAPLLGIFTRPFYAPFRRFINPSAVSIFRRYSCCLQRRSC